MLKLIKYEFRKNIVTLITMCFVLVGLETYFVGSFWTSKLEHMGLASSFLVIASIVCFFIVFVLGINNYEKELNSKSSYLIFMTPNSSLKIIVSKLCYVIILGLFSVIVIGGLAAFDLYLLGIKVNEQYGLIDLLKMFAESLHIDLGMFWGTLIIGIVYSVLSVLSIVTIAYMAITLSTTLLQNNRFRKTISTVLFILLMILVNYIDNKFIHSDMAVAFDLEQIFHYALPSIIYNGLIMVGCTLGCSVLIDKAINL